MLQDMLLTHGYQGFSAAPIPFGWNHGWMLWWIGQQIAHVQQAKDGGARVHLDARKTWETKNVRAASSKQGKRSAERWCAVRLYLS